MDLFPPSEGYLYILLAVDYVSKWVEAIATGQMMLMLFYNFCIKIFSHGLALHEPLLVMRDHIFVISCLIICSRNMGLSIRSP